MTTALAERTTTPGFTPDQVALIKRTIAPDLTDDELKLFIYQCNRTGLDPFTRQIYVMKRRQQRRGQWVEVAQTQTAIDGFRVIANRTGEYDGHDIEWCGPDGAWRDVWLDTKPPAAARVVAYRKNCAKPFPAIARWDEYVQTTSDGTPVAMWKKMPANQLAKCAEALALRKAFPNELSGLYTSEEMAQAGAEDAPPPPPVTKPLTAVPADGKQRLAEVKPYNVGRTQFAEVLVNPTGEVMLARGPQLISLCEQLVQDGAEVDVETKVTKTKTGQINEIIAIHKVVIAEAVPPAPEVSADEIPF